MNQRWDPEGAARGRVVLLHGIMSTAATWWRVGPALASRGWVVDALDLPGHGDWPRSARPLGMDALVDGIAGRLGSPVDLLVGHSLGGAVAVALAGRRPPGRPRLGPAGDGGRRPGPAAGAGRAGRGRARRGRGQRPPGPRPRGRTAQLPPDRFVVLDGGHRLHRDLPARWLEVVGGFADTVLGTGAGPAGQPGPSSG